jgi:hypothetical protein
LQASSEPYSAGERRGRQGERGAELSFHLHAITVCEKNSAQARAFTKIFQKHE